MAESNNHEMLKRVAESVLRMDGYEVEKERFLAGSRVDVYGDRNGETVAVEIGNLENERADYIKENVDELVHVPYGEYDPDGHTMGRSKKRVNVSLDGDDWDRLSELVGDRNRSELIRQFISVYLKLNSE